MAHVLFVIVFFKNVNRVTVPQFQVSPHVESMIIIFPRKDTRPRSLLYECHAEIKCSGKM